MASYEQLVIDCGKGLKLHLMQHEGEMLPLLEGLTEQLRREQERAGLPDACSTLTDADFRRDNPCLLNYNASLLYQLWRVIGEREMIGIEHQAIIFVSLCRDTDMGLKYGGDEVRELLMEEMKEFE